MPDISNYLSDKLESLKVRILGGIFVIFFLAVGMVLFGVWTYQKDKLIALTSQKSIELSDIIVTALRSSMLQNDRETTMKSIHALLEVAGSERISIINSQNKITMTSDPEYLNKKVDPLTDLSCSKCHLASKKMERSVVVEKNGEKFINTVQAIRNQPPCYGCHPKDKKILGILLVESSFRETEDMLKDMALRIILTGIFAFLIGVMLIHYIVTRFITKPLKLLQKGFTRVGQGDFTYWVDVNCSGEIGQMGDLFNVMSRAISRSVNELEGKTSEVEAHYSIVKELSQTIERKKLKEVVVELLYRILTADCSALVLAMEKNRNIFEIVQMNRSDKRHYHSYYNLDSGDLELDAITHENIAAWKKGEILSISFSKDGSKLLIPLAHKNMSFGFAIVTKPKEQSYSDAEMKIIPALAHHISLSLANAHLYNLAITDGLTTLYTKRHFEKKIDDFIHNFHVTKRGFCLLILDLDNFKDVNDEHGHPVGDKVLVKIADLIRSNIRHGDLPFRYGGEEFTVLLQGDEIEAAVRIAERIRRSVERTPMQINTIEPFTKTVSIGVACYPHHYTSADEVINAADKALYKAKNNGRNQVIVYCRSSYGEPECD